MKIIVAKIRHLYIYGDVLKRWFSYNTSQSQWFSKSYANNLLETYCYLIAVHFLSFTNKKNPEYRVGEWLEELRIPYHRVERCCSPLPAGPDYTPVAAMLASEDILSSPRAEVDVANRLDLVISDVWFTSGAARLSEYRHVSATRPLSTSYLSVCRPLYLSVSCVRPSLVHKPLSTSIYPFSSLVLFLAYPFHSKMLSSSPTYNFSGKS